MDHVTLLGTKGGPAIRPGSTMPTSNLLTLTGRQIVVDCGLGVARGLTDAGMNLRDLSLIFITHLHSDHYLELGPLLHTAWTAGLKTPVEVWGPAGLRAYWEGFLASMKDDIDLRIEDEGRPDLRGLVTLHVIWEGRFYEADGLSVAAMKTIHPPLVECYALSFRTDARHIVFSGDTAYFPALAEFAKGADILIHEAMLAPALDALMARIGNGSDKLMEHFFRAHTEAADAARIAAAAGVGRLVLNHLIPSDDPAYTDADWLAATAPIWDGAVTVGRDGLRIELG